MHLSVHCPTCDSAIKAPPDAAGRIVNCPKCGEPMSLPKELPKPVRAKVVSTAKGAKPEFDEEEEAEDRPRKKKGLRRVKKPKSSSRVILGIGLGSLLFVIVGVIAIFLTNRSSGLGGKATVINVPVPPINLNAKYHPHLTEQSFRAAVRKGMTESEVRSALGEPTARGPSVRAPAINDEPAGLRQVWSWATRPELPYKEGQVGFLDGRVVGTFWFAEVNR